MKEHAETVAGITPGSAVVIVLHSPREKFWGLLDEISSAGVFCRGLDLNAFDDWLSAVAHAETYPGVGAVFFPMWRVERIAKDETVGELPSMADQVLRRTGRAVEDVLRNY
jgi:hypothetical protein